MILKPTILYGKPHEERKHLLSEALHISDATIESLLATGPDLSVERVNQAAAVLFTAALKSGARVVEAAAHVNIPSLTTLLTPGNLSDASRTVETYITRKFGPHTRIIDPEYAQQMSLTSLDVLREETSLQLMKPELSYLAMLIANHAWNGIIPISEGDITRNIRIPRIGQAEAFLLGYIRPGSVIYSEPGRNRVILPTLTTAEQMAFEDKYILPMLNKSFRLDLMSPKNYRVKAESKVRVGLQISSQAVSGFFNLCYSPQSQAMRGNEEPTQYRLPDFYNWKYEDMLLDDPKTLSRAMFCGVIARKLHETTTTTVRNRTKQVKSTYVHGVLNLGKKKPQLVQQVHVLAQDQDIDTSVNLSIGRIRLGTDAYQKLASKDPMLHLDMPHRGMIYGPLALR